MKKLLFASSLLLSTLCFAQKQGWSDVHLKSGSIIKGKVVEETDTKLKLETFDKSLWVFDKSEVVEIVPTKKFRYSNAIDVPQKGYYNITDIGLLPGNGERYYRSSPVLSVQTVNGYRINRFLATGIGVGIEQFDGLTLIPIFAEARIDFLTKAFTPFVAIQGGYSVPATKANSSDWYSNKYYGGVMFNPTVGIRKYVSANVALLLSAGYRYQISRSLNSYTSYYWGESGNYTTEIKNIYNRVSLRVGLLFN